MHDDKYKTNIQTTDVKRELNETKEKLKRLCYNCLRDDHFTSKCESKNTCFKEGSSSKHHTALHDYSLLKQKKRDKDSEKHVKDGSKSKMKEGESIKVNTYKTSNVSERVFLQIVSVKVIKIMMKQSAPFHC